MSGFRRWKAATLPPRGQRWNAPPTAAAGRQPPTLIDYQETTWMGNGAKSTPSISWQTGDRVVVWGAASNNSALPTPTATGLTFTGGTPVSDATASWENTWTATAGSNGSSTINSTGTTGAGAWGMGVWVWRGSDGFGNAAGGFSTAKTINLARSQDESAVIGGVADFAAGPTGGYAFTPAITGADHEREVATNGLNWSIYVADWVDEDTAGTTAYGITGTTSTAVHTKLFLEVLGTTAVAGTDFTQTVTDPVGLADSRTQALDVAQTEPDPVGISDSRTQVGTFAQTVTDPVGLSDSTSQSIGQLAAYIQTVGSQLKPSSSTTNVITVGAGISTTVGNRLILAGGTTLSNAADAITVTDSRGNTWTVYQRTGDVLTTAFIASCAIAAALVAGDTITVTQGGTATGNGYAACYEWSGLATPVNSNGGTATSTTPSSGNVTMTGGAAYFGALMTSNATTPVAGTLGTPWTQRNTAQNASGTRKWYGIWDRKETAGATVAHTPTLGTSTQWADVEIAFTSATEPPTPSLVYGWAGAVTATSAAVAASTAFATSARLKVSTTSDLLTSPVFSGSVTPDTDGYARLSITGLSAGTQYYYGVELNGSVVSPTGSFKTAPAGAASFSFAFGSCALTASSTAWTRAKARNPDLCVICGDFPYADVTTNNQVAIRDAREALVSLPEVHAMVRQTPTAYVWSDHDFGANNSNSTAASKPAAQVVYRQQVPHHTLEVADAIYHSFVYGRVRFILTDNRSFKSVQSDTDNSAKTVLGATQKTWFKNLITSATEPLIFWVNEQPWIGAAVAGEDEWSGYTTERTELANHIQNSGKNVIILAGDMHAVAADSGVNSPGGIPVMHGAPWRNVFSNKGGPYSSGPYPTSGTAEIQQYGWVQVGDSGAVVTVTYAGYDDTDTARASLLASFAADPVGIGDAVNQAATIVRTITDSVGVVDAASQTVTGGGTSYTQTVTDPVGLVDSRAQVSDATRTAIDPVGLVDSRAQVAAYSQAITDLAGLSDAGIASDIAVVLTDAVGIVDSVSQSSSGAGTATFTDPVGLVDSRIQVASFDQTVTDSVGLVDSQPRQLDRSLADPVGLADSQTQALAASQTEPDPVGLLDSQAQQTDGARTQTDPVGITDSQVVFKGLDVVITDSVGLTDSQSLTRNTTLTVTDPVGIVDSQAQQFSGVTSLTITDPVGLTDSRTQEWVGDRTQTDPVGLVDAATDVQGFGRPITDPVGITDPAGQAAGSQRTTTDPVGLADQATPLLGGPLIFNDPVGITDTVSYLVVDVTPRWVEHASTASGVFEGAAAGTGIVEGSSSL